MPYKKVDNLKFEDARIIFRNFAGQESKFNRDGNRNFCLIIDDPNHASALIEEGWNVKSLKPRDEDEEPKYYIPVAVDLNNPRFPCNVYLMCGNKRTVLDNDTISTLDRAEIRSIDLIIRPHRWEVNDRSGIKAYLKTMYVTIEEDDLAKKYADFEDGSEDEDFPF